MKYRLHHFLLSQVYCRKQKITVPRSTVGTSEKVTWTCFGGSGGRAIESIAWLAFWFWVWFGLVSVLCCFVSVLFFVLFCLVKEVLAIQDVLFKLSVFILYQFWPFVLFIRIHPFHLSVKFRKTCLFVIVISSLIYFRLLDLFLDRSFPKLCLFFKQMLAWSQAL